MSNKTKYSDAAALFRKEGAKPDVMLIGGRWRGHTAPDEDGECWWETSIPAALLPLGEGRHREALEPSAAEHAQLCELMPQWGIELLDACSDSLGAPSVSRTELVNAMADAIEGWDTLGAEEIEDTWFRLRRVAAQACLDSAALKPLEEADELRAVSDLGNDALNRFREIFGRHRLRCLNPTTPAPLSVDGVYALRKLLEAQHGALIASRRVVAYYELMSKPGWLDVNKMVMPPSEYGPERDDPYRHYWRATDIMELLATGDIVGALKALPDQKAAGMAALRALADGKTDTVSGPILPGDRWASRDSLGPIPERSAAA